MSFFQTPLREKDPEILESLKKEFHRQKHHLELIASENYVSSAVLEAMGSLGGIFTNKYAEGYPKKRYYGGCEYADEVESLCRKRAKELFKVGDFIPAVNVQSHSGAQANQAVFLALLNPGDKILSCDLSQGGHLTHGSSVNLSGKWFDVSFYGLDRETETLDYDVIEKLALETKPKLIIAGYSAYPRTIDFKRFREIADKVGAFLLVDMAHIAGLVAAGAHPSPFPYAHVVTSTTHKTLRGPRGGLILSQPELGKKINSAVFPGLQGGPLIHTITAKAVMFQEALTEDFKTYSKQVIKNAQTLANALIQHKFRIVSGGTDNHLILVDLQSKNISGKAAEKALDLAGINANRNTIPYDPASPFITSGIRLGTPALTSRGMKEKEMQFVADKINEVIINHDNPEKLTQIKKDIYNFSLDYPLYNIEELNS